MGTTVRVPVSAPTINQLSQFGKKLRIPVGYFSLDQPINVPPVYAHRTIANAAIAELSRELVDVSGGALPLLEAITTVLSGLALIIVSWNVWRQVSLKGERPIRMRTVLPVPIEKHSRTY